MEKQVLLLRIGMKPHYPDAVQFHTQGTHLVGVFPLHKRYSLF